MTTNELEIPVDVDLVDRLHSFLGDLLSRADCDGLPKDVLVEAQDLFDDLLGTWIDTLPDGEED